MNVRVRFEWLLAFSVLLGGAAWAQDQLNPGFLGQVGSVPVQYPPPEAYFASPGAYPYAPPPGTPDLYAELLPRDRGGRYDTDSRLDLDFREMLRGSWIRLEYLHGSIHHNGVTLGNPTDMATPNSDGTTTLRMVTDVAEQFLVIYTPTGTASYLQVPTSKGMSGWSDAQGVRASFGIPVTKKAWFEASFLAYMNQTNSLNTPEIPAMFPTSVPTYTAGEIVGQGEGPHGTNLTTLLGTTYTINGQISSYTPAYDAGFESNYESRFKQFNTDIVFNWRTPELGFRAQPILGYRHEQYDEGLAYTGLFDNRYGTQGIGTTYSTPLYDSYNSRVTNQRDQVELGIRNELAFRYVTFGAQEKFGLGTNTAKSTVLYDSTVFNIDPNDPFSSTSKDKQVVFAPTFDLDVYAKVKLTEWMNFRVGYSLMLLGNIAAADRSIRYNAIDDGTTLTPDVHSKLSYDYRVISALTLGGEIVLP
ncbi:BBP7 family outer membrane beta-barrel protein [Planctomicrobium sp. SH661]|uniref:BBP7 family outer membrane beta-barrel protein n=1 Tax=Planctomicrobium sp. SH661 TaxID=3448124 RepID=UPI003F5AE234